MELSPRLLRDVEFGEQWRGYNQAEVDEFLERVAAALESLVERFQETTARAEAAERRLLERGEDDEIRRTLVLAQRTAAAAVDEARAEAERIVAAADAAASERLAAAEARLQAVEREVDDRTRAEMQALEARRRALASDVDALVAFVDEHRSRLAGELRRELAWLERPELEVPTPPVSGGAVDTSTAGPASERGQQPPTPEQPTSREQPLTPEQAAAEDALGAGDADEPRQDMLGDDRGDDGAPAAPHADDLAAAREELERALAGVADEPEQPADDATPRHQLFDVLAEEEDEDEGASAGEATGLFDVLGGEPDEPDEPDEDDDVDLHWRQQRPEPPAAGDDDPFLTELRKAITDDDPLGPRDHAAVEHGDDDSSEEGASSWFRLRRPRG